MLSTDEELALAGLGQQMLRAKETPGAPAPSEIPPGYTPLTPLPAVPVVAKPTSGKWIIIASAAGAGILLLTTLVVLLRRR